MGGCQTEQPKLGKVAIWPAIAISPTAPTLALTALTEDAPQAHACSGVEVGKHGPVAAVLKVDEPALEAAVHVADDARHALAGGAGCLLTDGVSKFLDAFPPRPVFLPTKAADWCSARLVIRHPSFWSPSLHRR